MSEICAFSATELARRIQAGELSSREAVQACLDRIEKVNPHLNAFLFLDGEGALRQAEKLDQRQRRGELAGPLHGVPLSVKDCLDVAGMPCTAGTLGRRHWIPTRDAPAVARLRAAGAVVLGKGNLPELSFAFESDNLMCGPTRNPYHLERTCGGSSGGEAALLAAGCCHLGLGTDAGGSIRVPAHFCGITGLKPTTGRVPRSGCFPPPGGIADPIWQVGPMARSVEDLSLAFRLLAGPHWEDPSTVPVSLSDPQAISLSGLRVAFHDTYGILDPDPAIQAAVRRAASLLQEAGAHVEEARPEGIEEGQQILFNLLGADGGEGLAALLAGAGSEKSHPSLEAFLKLLRPRRTSAAGLAARLVQASHFRQRMAAFLQRFDVILSPVCGCPAPPHGSTYGQDSGPLFSYTMTYNMTGWPAATVRAGRAEGGLPVGVQIAAGPFREDQVLAVAAFLEKALGGWEPPSLTNAQRPPGPTL